MGDQVIVLREDEVRDQCVRDLYKAVMNKKGEEVIRLCQQKIDFDDQHQDLNLYKLPLVSKDYPLTTSNDTVLHMATYTGQNQLVKRLLDLVRDDHQMLKAQNEEGDTILHEAATNEEIEEDVVCMMLDLEGDLLKMTNSKGETPLFRAVNFGNEKMFRYLVDRMGNPSEHWRRKDGVNILHIAIITEFFDLALEIVKTYRHQILDKVDESGRTALQVLASMPSAFKSGTKHKLIKRVFYYCAPSYPSNDSNQNVFGKMNRVVWDKLLRGWPWMDDVWHEKRTHESVYKLAQYLIENDLSWKKSEFGGDPGIIDPRSPEQQVNKNQHDHNDHRSDLKDQKVSEAKEKNQPETPLLIATSNGIEEIVKNILKVFPQAVEHVSPNGQNILHIAVKNRQRKIFDLLKGMKLRRQRLRLRIDKEGNTALHQVAFMEDTYRGEQPGPALQLGEELLWFKEVREELPPHFVMHHNNDGLTANELFNKCHKELLGQAQDWLKRTSESCSVVAVLIATVAFAAAYTVPGGANDKGEPILFDHPFFLVFTVMDVVSLASSLASVVLFLSILTSPFQFDDFKQTLPRRLTLGFTFLFMSVAAMMLAFAATIILTIQTKRQSAKLLIYVIAFLPVSIFAFSQLPLYMALTATAKYTAIVIKKALPNCESLTNRFGCHKKKP